MALLEKTAFINSNYSRTTIFKIKTLLYLLQKDFGYFDIDGVLTSLAAKKPYTKTAFFITSCKNRFEQFSPARV
ncbi:MAG: hypothetical protein D6719_08300 [Candidatus Dadabacteria bacterium]|nr:MAG: hypothetical protein D6719_08300 [Candidatus Dadabacteria bacterium]